ncbi:MAG TPA: ISKra4 family transposase [Firmicutes bacterium]|nr:ISKra4 family transposase [Bacillota bacterium]
MMRKRENVIQEVAAVAERLLRKIAAQKRTVDLHDIEMTVREASSEIDRLLLKGAVDEVGTGYSGSKIRCECGGKLKFVGNRPFVVTTLSGEVRIERAYYHCDRCGASKVPIGEQLKLSGSHFSEGVINNLSYCCAELPFEPASELMGRLTGIYVSPKEAQILSESIGKETGEELDEQAEVAMKDGLDTDARPERLYMAIDGVMINEQDGWHEAKTAAIYDAKEQINADGSKEDVANEITYVARGGSPDELIGYISVEAQRRGVEYAKELIVLGDGAAWIWNMVRSYFPGAIQIIDWYHASEHVWRLGRVLWDGDEERCKCWVEEQLEVLKDVRVEDLITKLAGIVGLSDEAASERDKLMKYLQDNRDRMRYDEYRAKGYHIGSGVVESACKHVVQMRHKRSGMRWSASGAQEVLNLRVFLLNGRWDDFWRRRRQEGVSDSHMLAGSTKAA